jgi:F-type H+-transporting ATPase subunit b
VFESFIGVNFWTALFVLINTLTVYFVAKKYLFVPVKNMIDSRQKEIDEMYQLADEAKEASKLLQVEYEKKMDEAQQMGERIVQESVVRGQNREEEIIRQAHEEAAAILDKASADIAQEKKKAINDAKNEISEIAMAIAEKVVGRELNQKDQTQLVDAFIDALGDTL